MASVIASIARVAHLSFAKGVIDESFPENFARLKDLINQVTAKDVNLSHDVLLRQTGRRSYFGRCAPVTYMGVFENEIFSVGIFIIHPGCRIPLHDHPEMHGIIKVLHGHLTVRSYTVLGNELIAKAPKSVGNGKGIVVCKHHEEVTISTQDQPCVLGPSDGNIHEISSVDGPVAFLDVLAPPYMDERDCHYYESLTESQIEVIPGQKEKVNFLKHIPPPKDFWCDSAKYTGPNILI